MVSDCFDLFTIFLANTTNIPGGMLSIINCKSVTTKMDYFNKNIKAKNYNILPKNSGLT
jgi:hypothetical protein